MFVLGGVGAAVVGAAVGPAVVRAGLGLGLAVGLEVGLAVGLGASDVGTAVRSVALGDEEADGLGDAAGDDDAPAKRDRPPPSSTPTRRRVRRPPATAARIRSIQRGPRRGGGMIFVVSDMSPVVRTQRADVRSGVCAFARLSAR